MLVTYKDQEYTAREVDMKDQVLYQVFQDDKYLFTVGINENGNWESVEDVDQELAAGIGDVIESKTM